MSIQEQEDYVFALLSSLPRANIANIQNRMTPLLRMDIVGSLPVEIALDVLSWLPWDSLLACSLVSRRWRVLSSDPSLWRTLCTAKNWAWRSYPKGHSERDSVFSDSDDEGMGEDEMEDDVVEHMLLDDSGFASMDLCTPATHLIKPSPPRLPQAGRNRHSAPSILPPQTFSSTVRPDYKLLFATQTRLRHRFLTSSYSLSTLQTRGAAEGHTNTIYCLQLYTYPETGMQVLFTGSKDRSIREWDLATGTVRRVLDGIHEGSVLSICVYNGLLASGGSDKQVVVWELERGTPVRVLRDHEDSVLCVRFDGRRLVSCSKDRTIRTYDMPNFQPRLRLEDHRAAVNAIAISETTIVSGSGDRSMKVWDAETGRLLQTFENHHGRGLASIDFQAPFVLSGSSDKHLRLLDLTSRQGWSTSPEVDEAAVPRPPRGPVCRTCGRFPQSVQNLQQKTHEDLVRSVCLNADFVVSGSYDHTIKVWDRETGTLVADLTGGHTGRIFCVAFDYSKIVSCGEDHRICVWDFSHGIDTSFVKLH